MNNEGSAVRSIADGIRAAALERIQEDPANTDRLAAFLDVHSSAIEGLKLAKSWELPLALRVADGLAMHLRVDAG